VVPNLAPWTAWVLCLLMEMESGMVRREKWVVGLLRLWSMDVVVELGLQEDLCKRRRDQRVVSERLGSSCARQQE
jgi:hypothetical protein